MPARNRRNKVFRRRSAPVRLRGQIPGRGHVSPIVAHAEINAFAVGAVALVTPQPPTEERLPASDTGGHRLGPLLLDPQDGLFARRLSPRLRYTFRLYVKPLGDHRFDLGSVSRFLQLPGDHVFELPAHGEPADVLDQRFRFGRFELGEGRHGGARNSQPQGFAQIVAQWPVMIVAAAS